MGRRLVDAELQAVTRHDALFVKSQGPVPTGAGPFSCAIRAVTVHDSTSATARRRLANESAASTRLMAISFSVATGKTRKFGTV
jgi:hypothetical protein